VDCTPDAKDRPRALRCDAREFFESAAVRVTLSEVVSAAIDPALAQPEPPLEFFISPAQWARLRNRSDLVTDLVVASGASRSIVLPRGALLAEPYVEHAAVRRNMWPDLPLEFLESVWLRACNGETGLADAVRRLLPAAYS
jgi:hypothetical protein